VAQVVLSRRGKLLFTDYLSLYRMDGRWQIVSKIFHSHHA
jgi:putative lumazine-binding protein